MQWGTATSAPRERSCAANSAGEEGHVRRSGHRHVQKPPFLHLIGDAGERNEPGFHAKDYRSVHGQPLGIPLAYEANPSSLRCGKVAPRGLKFVKEPGEPGFHVDMRY